MQMPTVDPGRFDDWETLKPSSLLTVFIHPHVEIMHPRKDEIISAMKKHKALILDP